MLDGNVENQLKICWKENHLFAREGRDIPAPSLRALNPVTIVPPLSRPRRLRRDKFESFTTVYHRHFLLSNLIATMRRA